MSVKSFPFISLANKTLCTKPNNVPYTKIFRSYYLGEDDDDDDDPLKCSIIYLDDHDDDDSTTGICLHRGKRN